MYMLSTTTRSLKAEVLLCIGARTVHPVTYSMTIQWYGIAESNRLTCQVSWWYNLKYRKSTLETCMPIRLVTENLIQTLGEIQYQLTLAWPQTWGYHIVGKFGGQKIWWIVLQVEKSKFVETLIWRIPADVFSCIHKHAHISMRFWWCNSSTCRSSSCR